MSFKDLTGRRFGFWKIIERVKLAEKETKAHWKVICDCGHEFIASTTRISRRQNLPTFCKACR